MLRDKEQLVSTLSLVEVAASDSTGCEDRSVATDTGEHQALGWVASYTDRMRSLLTWV